MKKRKFDAQFRALTYFRIPLNKKMTPAFQTMFRTVMGFHSDRELRVRHRRLPSFDGRRIPVSIIEPRDVQPNAPCLVYFHGGGFILPAVGYHYHVVREYVRQTGCKVVFPDYRLAPVYPFPTAHEDCYAIYEWVCRNHKKLNIDPKRIAVGGDSAGGCLSAGVTLMARDRGFAAPCCQMLVYPVTDRRMETESAKTILDAPVWDRKHSEAMWAWYTPDSGAAHLYYTSPMEAEDLTGLPDAYVETADFDSLRDEGKAYAERLQEAGVNVEYHLSVGTVHGFEMVWNSQIVRDCVKQRCDYLNRIFNKD